MTILKHEIRQGRTAFLIWTCAIASLLAVCIFLYPEMKDEMGNVTDMFASMGAFSAAFGMDRLNFGSLTGFFSVECGNVLGLGGGLFASMLAAGMLSKEEKDKTAEFLLTHPVSRVRVLSEKLAAVLLQITFMNLTIYAVSIGAVYAIGEDIPWRELNLMLLAYYLMQLELDFVEGNTRAQALYEKMGFKIVAERPNAIRLRDGRLLKEYSMILPL